MFILLKLVRTFKRLTKDLFTFSLLYYAKLLFNHTKLYKKNVLTSFLKWRNVKSLLRLLGSTKNFIPSNFHKKELKPL